MEQEQWQSFMDRRQTPEARKAFLLWLQAQDDAALTQSLASGWEPEAPPMPASLNQKLKASLDQQLTSQRTHTLRRVYLRRAAAASVLLAMLTSYYLLLPHRKPAPVAVASIQKVFNASTAVKRVSLPDGSQVWLSPQSGLEIPAAFHHPQRRLTLTGEAYFEVTPGATYPFTVDAGHVSTVVLGTHFNMQAYPEEDVINVALSAGSVAVHLPDSVVLLSPAHQLTYKKETQQFSLGNFAIATEKDWKTGALVLDDVPLALAFHKLEYRFGKQIIFPSNAFTNARFTATYHQEPLSVILSNMGFIHDFRYTTKGDSIFVHPLP